MKHLPLGFLRHSPYNPMSCYRELYFCFYNVSEDVEIVLQPGVSFATIPVPANFKAQGSHFKSFRVEKVLQPLL